jgi:predicted phage terminase large subunit-like protein
MFPSHDPKGGALFKPEWFVLLDEEPEMLMTFITADTAETSKSYNDATVFSFWGLYEIDNFGAKTGEMGLHWIDCVELRIEPKDLHNEFISFWSGAARHKCPPLLAAIEKKSTGVTLISTLESMRGIQIRDIQRTRASGSKAQRFLECQPYVAAKKISFTKDAKHVDLCINHMTKLTANDSHRFDDVGDTCMDAIKLALIDKTLYHLSNKDSASNAVLSQLGASMRRQSVLRNAQYGGIR